MRLVTTAAAIGSIVLAVTTASWAGPEADVLQAVPDSALGVLVVHRLKDTSDRIEMLAGKLQVTIPNPLAFAKGLAGLAGGIDERGSLAIALFPAEEGQRPVPVVFIPVNNYDLFLQALAPNDPEAAIARVTFLGRRALAARKDNFAVLVGPAEEELLTAICSSATGIDTLIKPLGQWPTSQTVVGIALERGSALIVKDSWFSWLKGLNPAGPNLLPTFISKTAIYDGIRRLGAELDLSALGLELADSGAVTINLRGIVKSGGSVAKELQRAKWPTEPPFRSLPAGEFALAGGASFPTEWVAAMLDPKELIAWRTQDLEIPLTDQQQAHVQRQSRELAGRFKSLAAVLRVPQPENTWLEQALAVLVVDHAKESLADYERYSRSMNELFPAEQSGGSGAGIKQLEIDDRPAIEQRAELPRFWPDASDPDSEVGPVLEKLFGTRQRLNWFMAAVDQHRIAMAVDRRERIVEAAKMTSPGDSLEAEPLVKQAIALLPKQCQWVALADVRGATRLVNVLSPAIAPGAFRLPDFPKTWPAVAGARFSPREIEAYVILPPELLNKLGGFIAKVRQLEQED